MKRKIALVISFLLLLCRVIAAQDGCYSHDKVYIIGNMNIRDSYSTFSRVVATAQPGDSFGVSQSRRGDIWCWLNIGTGWLAKTSRVSPTVPSHTSASQTNQPSDIDNCCFVDRQCDSDDEWVRGFWAFQNNECSVSVPSSNSVSPSLPPIHGDAEFTRNISAAMNLLRNRSNQWFNYVLSAIRSIQPKSQQDPARRNEHSLAVVYPKTGAMYVKESFASTSDIEYFASAFVHEACHVYQWQSGKFSRWDWLFDIPDIERECYGIQATALSEISPGHLKIRALQCEERSHPWTFFC